MPDRRLAKDRSFMKMAEAAAELATCSRLKVGAVIVDQDGYVVATGRNGAAVGEAHCQHDDDKRCRVSLHSELNACLFAGRQKALGGTMFVTDSPCWDCAGAILNVGLVEVVFARPYRLDDGVRRLEAAGITVRRLG